MPRSIRRCATSQRSMFITIAPPTVLNGPVLFLQPSMSSDAIAHRGAVVEDHVGHVHQLLARRMGRLRLLAVRLAHDADDRQAALLRPLGHLDDDLADAAGRDDDQHVLRAEGEVAQDLLGVARASFPGAGSGAGRWGRR